MEIFLSCFFRLARQSNWSVPPQKVKPPCLQLLGLSRHPQEVRATLDRNELGAANRTRGKLAVFKAHVGVVSAVDHKRGALYLLERQAIDSFELIEVVEKAGLAQTQGIEGLEEAGNEGGLGRVGIDLR